MYLHITNHDPYRLSHYRSRLNSDNVCKSCNYNKCCKSRNIEYFEDLIYKPHYLVGCVYWRLNS